MIDHSNDTAAERGEGVCTTPGCEGSCDLMDEPTYDEVVVDSITAAVVAAVYVGVAGLALAGLQALWPDPAWPLDAFEVTLAGIGICAAVGGVVKGVVDAALGVQAVRFWRRRRVRVVEGGEAR